jgi:hypothetical protein
MRNLLKTAARPFAATVRATFYGAALTVALVVAFAAPSAAAESVLYRLFLMDGTTLISYGEFSRVADRVVFSIPVGATEATPTLELVSIPQASVDWERTDRYSDAVRARRYAETRGENDFAGLSSRVAEALNQITLTSDPSRRLAMAVEARGNLARWPADNYGYRAADVAQLVNLLDEVISELRVAAGQSSFDVSLVANVSATPPAELLPTPSLRDTMEQALAAAAITTEPAERVSLLRAVATALRDPALEGGWAATVHARASAELAAELRVDKAYGDLTSTTIAAATTRAARADVTGIQALVQTVLKADDRLGRRRPQETAALLALLDLRLDEARRLRLAQDAWIIRRQMFRTYRTTMAPALVEMRRMSASLESIRQLAGPEPGLLPRLEQRVIMVRQQLAAITPPVELQSAHELFTAAFQMARRAASGRRNAVLSGDMKLAWDASSAAAGALMLLERARQELDRLTAAPSPR